MHPNILKFLGEQQIFTLSTCGDSGSFSAVCYYAFDEARRLILFSSRENTRHIQEALRQPQVSGTVISCSPGGIIKAVQFSGRFFSCTGKEKLAAAAVYYKKYPFAAAMQGKVWAIEPEWIRLGSNQPLAAKTTWRKTEKTQL